MGSPAIIRKLPDILINQIAAGEVVERPAACVKELVENALDAGATQIDVTLLTGGQDLITVSDNGSGMDDANLRLAVERHATSKLPSDNLLSIASFGFRGEALPSIGAVSRLTITTRTDNGDGRQLTVEGGVVGTIKPAAHTHGTRIDVRDLFYSVPARLKFLKTPRTEHDYVLDHLQRLAMAQPHVAFTLTEEGRRGLRLPAVTAFDLNEARRARIRDIFGRDVAENLQSLAVTRDGTTVTGWVGLPTMNRPSPDMIYFFVNDRPVRDRQLLGALKAAYMDSLPHGRQPLAFVFIDLPGDAVDVNVHPAKAEVRFRDIQLIKGLMISGIRNTLAMGRDQADSNLANAALLAAMATNGAAENIVPFQSSFHTPLSATGPAMYETHAAMAYPHSNPGFAPAARDMPDVQPDAVSFPLGAARAQLHATYIVAETNDGLVIVDQHAAHERITYERMKSQLTDTTNGGQVVSQGLLLPEVVELDPASAGQLTSRAAELAQLGLELEEFGDGAVVVRAVPAILGETDTKGLVRDLAATLAEDTTGASLKARLDEVCSSMACHGSIRAGRVMNTHEMNALLRQMEATPFSGQCNHGRPTFIKLKRDDIEKLFARR